MEIKLGVPHTVRTGYKIYPAGSEFAQGVEPSGLSITTETQILSGNGVAVEMTFDSASMLLAGVTLLASVLAF